MKNILIFISGAIIFTSVTINVSGMPGNKETLLLIRQNATGIESHASGYFNLSQVTFGLGIGESRKFNSYGIQTVNGYKFNSVINLGLGVGLDKYNYATLLPVYLDVRIKPLKSFKQFVFEGSCGYSFDISGYSDGYYKDSYKGQGWGLYVNPAIGLEFPVFSKSFLNLNLGYKFQENTVYYLNTIIPRFQRMLSCNIGLMF